MPFTHGNKAIDAMSNSPNFGTSCSRKPLHMTDGNERKNETDRKEETHGPKHEAKKHLNSHDAQNSSSLQRFVKSIYSLRERTPETSILLSTAPESLLRPLTTESKVFLNSISLITSNHYVLHDAVETLKPLDWRKLKLLALLRNRPRGVERSNLNPIAFLIRSRNIDNTTLDFSGAVFSKEVTNFVRNGFCLEFCTYWDEHFVLSFTVSLNETGRTSGQWNVHQRS